MVGVGESMGIWLEEKEKGAFACVNKDYLQEGLTKREYFAACAMQAFITEGSSFDPDKIVKIKLKWG